jgi:hypothetical protein
MGYVPSGHDPHETPTRPIRTYLITLGNRSPASEKLGDKGT